MKYNFELFDLAIDKISEPVDWYVSLEKDHIVYHIEAYINKTPYIGEGEEEIYDNREDVYEYEHAIYKRGELCGVQMIYLDEEDTKGDEMWCVLMLLNQGHGMIRITFKKKKEAVTFLKAAQNYYLENTSISGNSK